MIPAFILFAMAEWLTRIRRLQEEALQREEEERIRAATTKFKGGGSFKRPRTHKDQ
jgi:hypothetical protein